MVSDSSLETRSIDPSWATFLRTNFASHLHKLKRDDGPLDPPEDDDIIIGIPNYNNYVLNNNQIIVKMSLFDTLR